MEAELLALLNFNSQQNSTVASDRNEPTPLGDSSSSMSLSRSKNSINKGSTSKAVAETELVAERTPQIRANSQTGKATEQTSLMACKGKAPVLETGISAQNRVEYRSLSRSSLHRKRAIRVREIDELEERLSVLEEETRTAKQAFFEAVHDRKRLIDEVYQHFQNVDSSLHIRDRLTGEASTYAPLAATSFEEAEVNKEDRGVGLSLVLCECSTPFVVRKEGRMASLSGSGAR
ncbi:uncharacterized protein LOC116199167 [Punica granatum]|uniref:BZIP domain-containing protein n=2 Tax=Punica granatum TaxID=22663 RepID=A0A218XBX1_PUNGR|nr:uncharacterized protein LOC116199167 [Punica granatum]OWM81852.1 hypothetical protein CDL15_Pgr007890 [Punica granatum]PKI48470.1 hypothetical protein CRG98_031092 [Punica granatum]